MNRVTLVFNSTDLPTNDGCMRRVPMQQLRGLYVRVLALLARDWDGRPTSSKSVSFCANDTTSQQKCFPSPRPTWCGGAAGDRICYDVTELVTATVTRVRGRMVYEFLKTLPILRMRIVWSMLSRYSQGGNALA